MAVIQISKIQLRRGKQHELDVGSLDTGELAFTTDTGRLFVGTDPEESGLWSDRTILPFDNIEVLTETSVETFSRLHDRMNRMTGPVGMAEGLLARRPYMEAQLAPEVTTWTNVPVFRASADGLIEESLTEDLILSLTRSISAQIAYFLFDGSRVVRSGVLNIMHDGNGAIDEAVLTDEHVADFQLAATGTPILVNQLFVTGLRFRALRTGSDPDFSFRLQFQNETNKSLRVQMRVMVAAKPEA
jgi:hypothetical protein